MRRVIGEHPLSVWVMASLAIVAAACCNVGAFATPASASEGGVLVSNDGVTFGPAYSGTLFDGIGEMVPGDTQFEDFYVSNASPLSGILRVTLEDVTFSDSDLAQALSVTASTFFTSGSPASILEANPCWVLVEGQTVAPGERVRVGVTLALGDLNGRAGQLAHAGLNLKVELSDAAPGSLSPTSCGRTGVRIPVLHDSVRSPASNMAFSPFTPEGVGNVPDAAISSPESDLPVLNLPGGFTIDPNTWNLNEHLLVLLLACAFVLGSGSFIVVAWLRRRRDDGVRPEGVS